MKISFSNVTPMEMQMLSSHFSAARIDIEQLDKFMNPVMGLDHFLMSGPTFAPHPHAGFSAISYLFEDSKGGMLNRDSMGHSFIAQPGDVIWTQAAHGLVHDEVPVQTGQKVHGIQLFVNLRGTNKNLPPEVFHLNASDAPQIGNNGNRVRLLVGCYQTYVSPLKPAEPFLMTDGYYKVEDELVLPPDWRTLFFQLKGDMTINVDGHQRRLQGPGIVGLHNRQITQVKLIPNTDSHLMVLAGPVNNEPVASYGPFIMNNKQEIEAAITRYRNGDMGSLSPRHG
ncbi:Pirin [Serratia ficaria]|uniref:Pirin n=2 Tax=Serratia ficaria TaxID=61651 RepID=A0A240AMZ9_SERFI|nr:hypothetical protein C7332_0180 [Serratia ficaria]CAI0940467.1 Pirin [Serratia ficaria]CAI0956492.1 Pirin [Serratia ficaria]CAI1040501.1 Pirin [Serratia ficaria]CAI2063405.1 Pirin [Serratia ficaria]